MGGEVTRSVTTLVAGLLLGTVVVALESRGTGALPGALGLAILLAGFGIGLLPLRWALPAAIVLSCNQGLITDFIGGPSRYWKEAFIAVLLVRALRRTPPSIESIAVVAATSAIFMTYAVFGTSLGATAWALKLLLQYAVFGWSVVQLRPGPAAWRNATYALFLVVAASIVSAVWQRQTGVDGLTALGLEFGETLRTGNGQLRAFAGFIYHAPYAYTMAIATLIWTAFLFVGDSKRAIAWSWVPVLATVGMVFTVSRIAFVGLAFALFVVALRRRQLARLTALGIVIVLAAAVFVGPSTRHYLSEGFTFSSSSAGERTINWSKRLAQVDLTGSGPGTAGAAATRIDPAGSDARAPGVNALSSVDLSEVSVVDNQYLSWLYQYGLLFGLVICGTFVVACLRPTPRGRARNTHEGVSAQLVGMFSLTAAFAINVWEEYPVNLLLALVIAVAWTARESSAADDPSAADGLSRPAA